MIDLHLEIQTVGHNPQMWQVRAEGVREHIVPLTDDDLRNAAAALLPDGSPSILPPYASTWDGLLKYLGSNEEWQLNPQVQELVGKLLHEHLVRGKIARYVARKEQEAHDEGRQLRYVVHVWEGEEDGLLPRLPFELLYQDGFWFRREKVVGVRLSPEYQACDVRLDQGDKILIAAAHANDREPSAAQLEEHVAEVASLLEGGGFLVRTIQECSPAALKSELQDGCHALYVVCHGEENLRSHGQLALRGGDVTGRELGEWLHAAYEHGHRVQAALLNACSSAVPGKRRGTMGMAQHLAATGTRAVTALGFRAPVNVRWALVFMTAVFRGFAGGVSLEAAVAAARRQQSQDDAQWSLPLLFAPRRGGSARPTAGSHGHSLPHDLGTLLPTAPRPYFTARQQQLDALRTWLASRTSDRHAALVGESGVGKSEIARVLAHDAHKSGLPVIWLERPDRDVSGCLTTMIRQREPGYRPRDGATFDDVRADMTRALGSYMGVLVLDDVKQVSTVDMLTPGNHWKVLVTTRQRALALAAVEIDVDPLKPGDALALLAKLAYEGESIPPEEQESARDLIDTLGYLPLTIELASGQLRRGASLDEVRAAALSDGGDESVLGRLGRLMERSLAGLELGDEAAWTLVAALPIAGVTEEHLALGLDEPEDRAERRLFRLRQANLLRFQTAKARYTVHRLARQVARMRAQEHGAWRETLARAAHVVLESMRRCRETSRRDVKEALRRWSRQRELIETLDLNDWPPGDPDADAIARALAWADPFRIERPPMERLQFLDEALARAQSEETLADIYFRRGELRVKLASLEGAREDFTRALGIYTRTRDNLGRAHVHHALGSLHDRSDEIDEAKAEYACALALYGDDALGAAHVYMARGGLRERCHDLEGAEEDLDRAFEGYTAVRSDLGLAHIHLSRGDLRVLRGLPNEAEADYTRALALYIETGSRLGVANTRVARGELEKRRRKFKQAEEEFERAIEIFTTYQTKLGLANVHRLRGELRLELEDRDIDGAEADYRLALELSVSAQDNLGVARGILGLGDVLQIRGKLEAADAEYARAMELCLAIHDDLGLAHIHFSRGKLGQKRGKVKDAEAEYARALELYAAAQANLGLARTHFSRALMRSQNELDGFEADFARASELFSAAGDAEGKAAAEQSLAALGAAQPVQA